MAIVSADLTSPLGPLRQETFRDASQSDFLIRVGRKLEKAQEAVTARAATDAAENRVDEAVEALALATLFEQAASIWAGLPQEESVAGEVSFKYLDPDQLRMEAERWWSRFNQAIALVEVESSAPRRRPGRLRRV